MSFVVVHDDSKRRVAQHTYSRAQSIHLIVSTCLMPKLLNNNNTANSQRDGRWPT